MIDKLIKLITFFIIFLIAFILGVNAHKNETFNKVRDYVRAGKNLIEDQVNNPDPAEKSATVWIDNEDQAHKGAILFTYYFRNNSPAIMLVDSKGNTLHRWSVEPGISNPDARKHHPIKFNEGFARQSVDDAYLLPNGDIIASHIIDEFESLRGQKLVRMNKDSEVIWQINDSFHHDIDFDPNGNIYAITSEIVDDFVGIRATENAAFTDEIINVISQDGEVLARYSVMEGFDNSKFKHLVTVSDDDLKEERFIDNEGRKVYDILHMNSAQYITSSLAKSNPLFEAGDFLLSMRTINAIAIYRPSINEVVWASRGPWSHQHYVKLREDGRIYLYDNEGGMRIVDDKDNVTTKLGVSRLLAFDPITREVEVVYDNPNDYSRLSDWRGFFHQLDDGTYIMNSSATGRIFQFNDAKEVVWEMRTTDDREKPVSYINQIKSTKFYKLEDLDFLQNN